MKVLIIGATGGTGRRLVEQALTAGHDVTAFVRDPEKIRARHERLRVVQGDILDFNSLDLAVAGQDAVLSSLGTKSVFRPVKIFSEGTSNLLRAMTKHGVRRLICITGIGAGDSRGHGGFFYDKVILPIFLKRFYQDKDNQEDLIRKSDLDWTIVRPGFLTNGTPKGNYRILTDLTGVTIGRISRADVAAFMLAELNSNRYLRQTPLLTD
ncbi:MAG: SDR family oxidoreductase [Candidatus Acidiferrales bacterium]